MRRVSPRTLSFVAVGTLVLLFVWVYGRAIPRLHFGMDDFILFRSETREPLAAMTAQILSGSFNWSGYRPLSVWMRAAFGAAFGFGDPLWLYLLYVGMHLVNTLLAYRVVRRVGAGVAWAWLAAAIVLLLPSHNEAVFWFSANASVLAMLWVLLALEFALTSRQTARLWPQMAAIVAYAFAVLSYEVTIALPLLVLAADWALSGGKLRPRRGLYVGFALAALAVVGISFWATGGEVLPEHNGYSFSANPLRMARGYLLLAGQMVLLHTSPWIATPIFANQREWLPLGSMEALVAIGLAVASGVAVFGLAALASRQGGPEGEQGGEAAPARPHPAFWLVWGLAWIVLLGAPFAGLDGRNPENRYTYLLSFGFAVSVTALPAWIAGEWRRSTSWRRGAAGAAALAAIALVAVYAYVSTSDAAEWSRAGDTMRIYEEGLRVQVPSLGPDETIAQLGVVGRIGTAYLYNVSWAFGAAVDLLYGPRRTPAFFGDLELRHWLEANPENAPNLHVIAYNGRDRLVHRIDTILFCTSPEQCDSYEVNEGSGPSPTTAWSYAQLYDPATPHLSGVGIVGDMRPWEIYACWPFHDPEAGTPLPESLEPAAISALCDQASEILRKESE